MAIVTVNRIAYETVSGTCLGEVLAHEQLIEMPCGGHGRCGKCRVIAEGKLSAPSATERRQLTREELEKGVRLACCTRVEGDCTVYLNEKAPMQIRTGGDMPAIALHPAFTAYGAAVDIGTTTLAARLYDTEGTLLAEASRLNIQSAWGADVISRIGAALKGDHQAIAAATCKEVSELLAELTEKAGIDPGKIDGVVITGNTVMLHLLTDTTTEPLSHAPFEVQRLFGEKMTAGELGISAILPQCEIYLPPCVAAFVGADTVTALLASGICRMPYTQMLVDIGTNGEIALWHQKKLTFCSTAAGPAFEGAGISMGMGGKSGAIDHITLREGKLNVHVIGDAAPAGICGSGVVDAVACLLENDGLDESGALETEPTMISKPVFLTQNDIRMVQLAKSAIHAGICTLLQFENLTCKDLFSLLIAGGFGSYLDIANAGRIGLIPCELLPRVRAVGNAALIGAAMLLLNQDYRTDCAWYAENATVVDLSSSPVFAEEYMTGMLFQSSRGS